MPFIEEIQKLSDQMKNTTKIQDMMTGTPVVANTNHKFSQVNRLFLEYGVHHLHVVETGDILIGVISSTDLLKAYDRVIPTLDSVNVKTLDSAISIRDMMTTDPISIHPEDSIQKAAELLTANKIQALPVTKEGKILGIVTTRDIVRAIAFN